MQERNYLYIEDVTLKTNLKVKLYYSLSVDEFILNKDKAVSFIDIKEAESLSDLLKLKHSKLEIKIEQTEDIRDIFMSNRLFENTFKK